VCVELGVEEWSEVALYTAVGSPLDRFHGIDAFFEFHGTIVSIDLTVGRKGSHKADLVIKPWDLTGRNREKLVGDICWLLQK